MTDTTERAELPHKLDTLIRALPEAPFREHLRSECQAQAERIKTLEKMREEADEVEGSLRQRIASLEAERDKLRAELETERMRLAACGVIATSNTPESAAANRVMLPEFWSGSAEEVAGAVDREMALRAEVERLRPNARRYEWLRSEHDRVDPICHLSWKRNGDRNSSEWVNTAQLDAAIDRAIESAKEQQ